MNPDYSRKLQIAAEIAEDYPDLAGMEKQLASLRACDADPVIIDELQRIYRKTLLDSLDS